MTDLYRLLPEEVDDLMASLGAPRYRAGQLLKALYHGAPSTIDDLRQLPADLRMALVEAGYTVGSARELGTYATDDAETTKLLLKVGGGQLIETVLMQYPDEDRHPRSTVCVSTQAGCAMACVFCATGQMGFEANLRAEDVVAQAVHFQRYLQARGEHVTNVVFMGMGEPLANYAETSRAVRILSHPRAFGLSPRRITVSTVGVIRGIERLAEEDLPVRLAISLHAPNNTLRRRLVPTAGPTSVDDLIAAARAYYLKTGRRVTIEYALIRGVNDGPAIARELAALIGPTGMHVNLIPVNPTAGGFQRPSRRTVLEFQRVLHEAGVNCTVRVEKGTEIAAACGQLRTDYEEARATAAAEAPPGSRPG